MIDQRVREGSKVNFFGSLATTTTIPAQLVKKYKCDILLWVFLIVDYVLSVSFRCFSNFFLKYLFLTLKDPERVL